MVPEDAANDWFRFSSRPHEYWDHRVTKKVLSCALWGKAATTLLHAMGLAACTVVLMQN